MSVSPARRAGAVTAAAALAAAAVTAAPDAYAIDPSKGRPGFCASGTGVTVVVDFQALGGTTIVRCDPQAGRGTGLDALKNAGFQIAGVQRWGEAFICRIENRPSAVEKIPIKGNSGYREACVDTPPASGYWSYWHAGNNCAWEYSQWGVKNRDFVQGGFEGWSFSLNATADTNPKPRVAAVRPGTAGQPCNAPDEPPPSGDDPNERQPNTRNGPGAQPGGTDPGGGSNGNTGNGGGTGGGQGGGGGGGDDPVTRGGKLPPPRPRDGSTADDPARNVAFSGGENQPDVDDVLKKQSGASDYAPWAAGGAAVALAAASWAVARRRRRARDA
ncbi:ABC transporter substrate-binding protein [Actinomadura harenae]|uniref:ABC transporter substrate-binding protein n=1 Tax=Actinomadura harenae TaxID=2483351 RepID=UPI0018F36203|nr:ABC transporter substrate-binding protein [Actinomadura harenae]